MIDAIQAGVPRYTEAHPCQILNALKKLETPDNGTGILISREMTTPVLVGFVNEYARRRDAEDGIVRHRVRHYQPGN